MRAHFNLPPSQSSLIGSYVTFDKSMVTLREIDGCEGMAIGGLLSAAGKSTLQISGHGSFLCRLGLKDATKISFDAFHGQSQTGLDIITSHVSAEKQ